MLVKSKFLFLMTTRMKWEGIQGAKMEKGEPKLEFKQIKKRIFR